MPRRTRQQAHHLYGLVGRHRQPPLALAVTERAAHTAVRFPPPRLQRLGGDRARCPRRHRELHARARRRPLIVDALDGHHRRLIARIDDPQPAYLVFVARRVEDSHVVPRHLLPTGAHHLGIGHSVVQRSQQPVVGAVVGQHLEVELRAQGETPVADTVAADALHQPLVGIALFQVAGVEVQRLVRIDVERHRTVRHTVVVERFHRHLAGHARAVDDANEPLVPIPIVGCGKQRHVVLTGGTSFPDLGREVRQMPRRTRQQAHHLDGLVRRHHQLPLPPPVVEHPAEPLAFARLQLLRRHRARRPRRYLQLHRRARRLAVVVDALDGDRRRLVPAIDDAKTTHLVDVARRVEDGHPVAHRFLARARAAHHRTRHEVVQGSQQPVTRAVVGQHLEVELGAQAKAPVAVALTDAARQTLPGVAVLEVAGVEVHRLARTDAKRHHRRRHAFVVHRVDEDLAGPVRTVDDPHEPLVPRGVGGGDEQRHAVRLPLLGAERGGGGTERRRDDHETCQSPPHVADSRHLRVSASTRDPSHAGSPGSFPVDCAPTVTEAPLPQALF